MLAMVVAEHDVRGDQAGAFRAASLRSVAEGAVLLKQRRAACRGRLVRLGPRPRKTRVAAARCSGVPQSAPIPTLGYRRSCLSINQCR
jgi:hypothetical protein